MLNIHVKRLNDNAIIPTKAHATDAGWDLYCDRDVDLDGESTRVTTGIKLAIPQGHYGQIQGRSGMASRGIVVHPGVIDSGFRGELEVVMRIANYQGDDDYVQFDPGTRIAQLIILPVPESQMVEVGDRDLPASERGSNGFGSSDEPKATPVGDLKDLVEGMKLHSNPFFAGPQDDEFWEDQDRGTSVTMKVGDMTIAVHGTKVTPGEGGTTQEPTPVEENEAVARAIAQVFTQDGSVASQDAPGQPEGDGKVESPGLSRIEAQRDFWKAEANRLVDSLKEVKEELRRSRVESREEVSKLQEAHKNEVGSSLKVRGQLDRYVEAWTNQKKTIQALRDEVKKLKDENTSWGNAIEQSRAMSEGTGP
jgi:dUTP pyrophosphatase